MICSKHTLNAYIGEYNMHLFAQIWSEIVVRIS